MGGGLKKKVGNCTFERIGRIAKYWRHRPSEYFKGLDAFEAFLIDEVCVVAVEAENKKQDDIRKEWEKQKEKAKKEAEEKAAFDKKMAQAFAEGDT